MTRDRHRAGQEVEGTWHDGSQNNEISCSFRVCQQNFGGRVCYLQDQIELLGGYSLTSTNGNNSKAGSWSSPICTFLSDIVHPLLASYHQFLKSEKNLHSSIHTRFSCWVLGRRLGPTALLTFCGFTLINSKNNKFGYLSADFTFTGKPCHRKRKPLVLIVFCSTTLSDVPPIRPQLPVPCIALFDAAQPASSKNISIKKRTMKRMSWVKKLIQKSEVGLHCHFGYAFIRYVLKTLTPVAGRSIEF